MDLEQQLRTYLEHYPEGIVDSNKIKGVLKDFKCPERNRDILVHLIDCGLGDVLKEKPGQLGSHLISSTIREMDQRYGTNEKYTLEGIRFWAKVYGIPVSYTDPLQKAEKAEVHTEKTVVEVDPPIPPRPERNEALLKDGPMKDWPIKHSGFCKIKDMRWQVKLMLPIGVLILIYNLLSFGHFSKYRFENLAWAAVVITCLELLYILKTGLPYYVKDQNGKYKEDWMGNILDLLAFGYFGLSLYQLWKLENEPLIRLDNSQFYIIASAFAVAGFGVAMSLIRLPKKAEKAA